MSHVYMVFQFVSNDENIPIKIGYSNDPEQRIKILEVSSPSLFAANVWKVNDARIIEKFLHKAFKDYAIRGEWYMLPMKERYECFEFLNSIKLHCTCRSCDDYFNTRRALGMVANNA